MDSFIIFFILPTGNITPDLFESDFRPDISLEWVNKLAALTLLMRARTRAGYKILEVKKHVHLTVWVVSLVLCAAVFIEVLIVPGGQTQKMPGKEPAKTYTQNIVEVLIAQGPKVRKTSSQEIIKQVASARGIDVTKARGPVKLALKKMVEAKTLIQLKGVGAVGSFKLNKVQVKAQAKAYRTPGAEKKLPKTMKTVKKILTGKTTTKKKPAAKKTTKKSVPKPSAGTKKAAAAKKAPTPAAAKKPAAKKQPAKKPAAKKQPVKKQAKKAAPAASAKKAKK